MHECMRPAGMADIPDRNCHAAFCRGFQDILFKLSPLPMLLAHLDTGRPILANNSFLALAGQGYLFARPMSQDDLQARFMEEGGLAAGF